ncbi:hypothetical protein AX774_g530 [Zancudomyces culisetae]|uniref:Uncharacterized protein n=1 Tax=Zancudomyces culisetae TaxID=1213189 RepID=A0A1R1PY84_ZANCU|nr:hypothetical protein AX774_g530 [Zancudomyces culisetae]|eukprot:OMH85913.1 hypothetical protein AX774_g530 [Zancudomyces culisetae]
MDSTTFDIYDALGTIKPVAELIGKVDFEPVLPMTFMEALLSIVTFIFILTLSVSGMMVYPKHKELATKIAKEKMKANTYSL